MGCLSILQRLLAERIVSETIHLFLLDFLVFPTKLVKFSFFMTHCVTHKGNNVLELRILRQNCPVQCLRCTPLVIFLQITL